METLPWFYAAVALFILYICVNQWSNRNFRGPKPLPVIGNTLEVLGNFSGIHDWITDAVKLHYPTFQFHLPLRDFVVTVDPGNIEYLLKTNFSNYGKGETEHTPFFDALGYGVFNSDGDLWRRHRKVASHEFASKVLRVYSSHSFKKHAVKLCGILDDSVKDKKILNMMDLAVRLSFESTCKVGFGLDVGMLEPNLPESPFAKTFDALNRRAADRFIDPFWRVTRFLGVGAEATWKTNVQHINTFTRELVLNRRAESAASKQTRPDLLSRYVDAVEKEPFTSNPFKDLQDSVLNFLFAGRDTTAAALAWTLYAISREPRVEEKIVEELFRVEAEKRATNSQDIEVDENGDDPLPEGEYAAFVRLLDRDTINNRMHYLQAAISESLRLYPPVPTNYRVPVEDDILPTCGTKVKAGDYVLYSAYAQGRMEQLWGKDCLEYKPERWLKNGVFRPESPYKFSAFHAGPRLCLGKESVTLHLMITLATLLRFFTFKLVPGEKVHYQFSITLHMKDNGLKMIAQKRS